MADPFGHVTIREASQVWVPSLGDLAVLRFVIGPIQFGPCHRADGGVEVGTFARVEVGTVACSLPDEAGH